MKEKILAILKTKCKDFGLTDKALDELARIASERVAENASDEDIQEMAESYVPIAKAMQGEITRKSQKKTAPSNPKPDDDQADGDGEEQQHDDKGGKRRIPAYLQEFMDEMTKRVDGLTEENNRLKKERSEVERKAAIDAKAKELGIPAYLMQRFNIGDDEDIDKVLTEYKQSLIDNGLPSTSTSPIHSSSEQEVKEAAQSWAEALPDK